MDGLECTEVLFSHLNAEMRLDSEYFYKNTIKMQKLIESKPHIRIGDEDVGFVTDGIHTSIDYVDDGYINLISATSPRENVFNLSREAYISEKAHAANPRTALRERDVILSTVGTIGNCAVVDKYMLPANADRHVGIIRLKEKLNPYFLSTFLLTKYGKNQTVRETTGNVQPNLFLYKIREIVVTLFTKNFQIKIEKTILKGQQLLRHSREKYNEAGKMLEKEIGFDMSYVKSGGISVKSFSESFGMSGRLDAEYYQPKYCELMEQLSAKGTIGTVCNIYDKTYMPVDNQEYKYIELANIGRSGEIENVDFIIGSELPSRARRIVKKGQVIVSSIEGSLNSCALITDEYNDAVCSTGFYVIDSESINSETLLVLIKSDAIQSLLKRGCSGTILTNITKKEFLDIPLPEVDSDVQKKIKRKIHEVYNLRNKTKILLEAAKQAVEMAIEQDEDTAVAWLDGKIEELTKEVDNHE